MHVLYFLVKESRVKFIDTVPIIICASGSIFVVQHHVKVPKAILC
jgi:hypothetical protein